jgi:hypothetical protein
VFSAILKRGVPTVPQEMKKEANRLASLVGCKIKDFGGNFEEVWFYFDRDLTEEEAEEIWK